MEPHHPEVRPRNTHSVSIAPMALSSPAPRFITKKRKHRNRELSTADFQFQPRMKVSWGRDRSCHKTEPALTSGRGVTERPPSGRQKLGASRGSRGCASHARNVLL